MISPIADYQVLIITLSRKRKKLDLKLNIPIALSDVPMIFRENLHMKLISLKISLKIIEKDYKIIKRIVFQIVCNMNVNRKNMNMLLKILKITSSKEMTYDKLLEIKQLFEDMNTELEPS